MLQSRAMCSSLQFNMLAHRGMEALAASQGHHSQLNLLFLVGERVEVASDSTCFTNGKLKSSFNAKQFTNYNPGP